MGTFRSRAPVRVGDIAAVCLAAVVVASLVAAQAAWGAYGAPEKQWFERSAALAQVSALAGRPEAAAALERLASALEGEPEHRLAESLAEDARLAAGQGGSAQEARARLRAVAPLTESLAARIAQHGRETGVRTDRARLASFGIAAAGLLAVLLLGGLLIGRLTRRHRRAVESGSHAEHERGRLEHVLRQLPMAMVRTRGPEHVIEFANARLLALWGPDAQGKRLSEIAPSLCQAWDRVFREGESLPDVRATQADAAGSIRHLNFLLEPARGPGTTEGAIEGVLGLAIDVSDLVEARASAERLQALAAGLARSLTAGEVAQVIVEQCLQAFGGSAGLLAVPAEGGRSLRIEGQSAVAGDAPLLPLDGPLPVCVAAREARVVVSSDPSDLLFCSKLPGWERARTAAFLPLCLDGRTLGVVGIASEHERGFGETERSLMLTTGRLCAQAVERAALYEAEKNARAQAEAAVQARDEFFSIASHELKTPLTALQLQLGRARRNELPRVEGPFEAAERSVARLGRLAHNLVDVSQVGADRLLLELEPVDLGATVREVAERFHAELAHSGSRLELKAQCETAGLWDRMRIEQIASNLLSNAVKFGGGRPIVVEVTRRGGEARLTVRDQGLGIAPENRDRIFRRLERAVSSRHYGGLGLGLWLTRRSVEALGGTIEVESEPGIGSTFVVSLPVDGPASSLGAAVPPA